MRRGLVEQIGFMDVLLSSGEFIDYVSRAMVLLPLWIKTDEVLFLRRIHGSNHTLTDGTSRSSYLSVIRQHLARRADGRNTGRNYT